MRRDGDGPPVDEGNGPPHPAARRAPLDRPRRYRGIFAGLRQTRAPPSWASSQPPGLAAAGAERAPWLAKPANRPPSPGVPASPAGRTAYVDPSYGFSIGYPNGFVVQRRGTATNPTAEFPSPSALITHYFGCGTTRIYGFFAVHPCGNFCFASSSETAGTMITSSPGFQFTGVATLCFAVN